MISLGCNSLTSSGEAIYAPIGDSRSDQPRLITDILAKSMQA
jgi:hypothetical protein